MAKKAKAKGDAGKKRLCVKGHPVSPVKYVPFKGSPRILWWCDECRGYPDIKRGD